jgi:hypothetical protein
LEKDVKKRTEDVNSKIMYDNIVRVGHMEWTVATFVDIE